MTIEGLSLFGFNLFGSGRRTSQSVVQEAPASRKQRKDGHLIDERDEECQRTESFFWGMYPVY